MRIGIRFSRGGHASLVSHLDMQRLFARAIRRSGLPVKYSDGFNPHIIMSFASAMGVGLETLGDYMEFETVRDIDAKDVAGALTLPEGIKAIRSGGLRKNERKLMAAVTEAEYILLPAEPGGESYINALKAVMETESCMALKRKKGASKEIDIRPLIRAASFEGMTTVRLALSGTESLSPSLLDEKLRELSDTGGNTRIIRTDLFTSINGESRSLEDLFV